MQTFKSKLRAKLFPWTKFSEAGNEQFAFLDFFLPLFCPLSPSYILATSTKLVVFVLKTEEGREREKREKLIFRISLAFPFIPAIPLRSRDVRVLRLHLER